MSEFIRENKYLVLKYSDINNCLSKEEKDILFTLTRKVAVSRINEGKKPLDCAIVESDSPKYKVT